MTIKPDPRDPPMRDDGACVVCGKPRRTDQRLQPHRATAALDPFCSQECCRAWYGVSLATDQHGTGYGAAMGLKMDDPLPNRA